MKKVIANNDKAKAVKALFDLFRTGHMSSEVYIIRNELKSDRPSIALWMSDYDYRTLHILSNGSRVSAFEVESNTERYRFSVGADGVPTDTEGYKYVVIS